MKSTFRSIKRRILSNSDASSSKSNDCEAVPDIDVLKNAGPKDKDSNRKKGKERRKAYVVEDNVVKNDKQTVLPEEIGGNYDAKDGIEPRIRANSNAGAKRLGFFRRSVYALRFSAIDDTQEISENKRKKLLRPKSVDVLNTPSSLSVLSLVRRSIRRSRKSDENVPVTSMEMPVRDETPKEGQFSKNVGDVVGCSSGDIANTRTSFKGTDETDAAKSTSIGSSDVNKSTQALNGKDVIDIDMNDIADNVARLDNKAAYDKIALRPKRRPARNARGAQQQHVIRVVPRVNGYTEVTSEKDGEAREDSGIDVSPPKAKKSRPPSGLLLTPQTDDEKNDSSSADGTSTATKRFSMLGKSPLGPGPGMIVPTLEDMQKIKLRKRQPEGKEKEMEEGAKPVGTLEPKPEKGSTPKTTKKTNATKKSSKQELKGSSEGGFSIFSWKKSASPKSPSATETSAENLKEIQKPKGPFPGLKTAKKNTQEKDSKSSSAAAKLFSTPDKKDSPKNRGILGGKPEKDHSENISETPHEILVDVAEEDKEKPDVPPENVVKRFAASPETERHDALPWQIEEKSLLDQISAEMSERQKKIGEELKEAKLAQSRFGEESKQTPPSSPADLKKHVFEGGKMTVNADVEQTDRTEKTKPSLTEKMDVESEKTTRSAIEKPSSPPFKEKPRSSSFKKPERLPSDVASDPARSSAKGLVVESLEDAESNEKSSVGLKASERKAFHSLSPTVAQVQRTEESNTSKSTISSSPVYHESNRNIPKSTVSSQLDLEKRTEITAKAKDQASEASASLYDKPKVHSADAKPTPASPLQDQPKVHSAETKPTRASAPQQDKPKLHSADAKATGPSRLQDRPKVHSVETKPTRASPLQDRPKVHSAETKSTRASAALQDKPEVHSADEKPTGVSLPQDKSKIHSADAKPTGASPLQDRPKVHSAEAKPTRISAALQDKPEVHSTDVKPTGASPLQDKPKVHSADAKPTTVVRPSVDPLHISESAKETVDTATTVQNKMERSTAPKREAGLEMSPKRHLSAKDDNLRSSGDDLKKNETAERRRRTASATTTAEVSPVEIYSRNKLKSVGGNLPGRRSASVKISPISSPSRASRPKSFSIKSARTNAEVDINRRKQVEIDINDEHKSEKVSEKSEVNPTSPKPSPTKEKPTIRNEKPKSPVKSHSRTANKSPLQEAENNNARPLNAAKESAEKTTPVSEQVSPKRPNSIPHKEDQVNAGAPMWVQMARRRSKIWEDGYKPQKNTSQRTPSTEDSGKQDVQSRISNTPTKSRPASSADKTSATSGDRPKTLPVTVKPRAYSTSKVSRSATTPSDSEFAKQPSGSTSKVPKTTSKSSPLSPSSKVQSNRTASIPSISMLSPRKTTPSPTKEVMSPGQPSWLAIAMQKQKNWAKEETV